MEAASKIMKRVSTGKCELMKYFDRGSQTWNYCLHLCNKGGGQQADCHSHCQDYLKCIGSPLENSDSGAQSHIATSSLSPESIAAIVFGLVVFFLFILGVTLGRRHYKNRQKRLVAQRNRTLVAASYSAVAGQVNLPPRQNNGAAQPEEDDEFRETVTSAH